jgi:RNA polymerase sigma factor (sigma-70 family)
VLEQNAIEADPKGSADAAGQSPQSTGGGAALAAYEASTAIERLYLENRKLLLFVACRKFRVPESDGEALVQEVFVSFMQTGTKVENVRAWLVAAMCNASRHYWRLLGRTESLPDDYNERSDPRSQTLADTFANEISMRQALAYLPHKCQDTLHLHYYEGRSAGDVAIELNTTVRYAEKLLHDCRKRLREVYLKLTRSTGR